MFIAAEGNRTPNLWFRRPTLCPIELQPLLLAANVVINVSLDTLIILVWLVKAMVNFLDGRGAVSVKYNDF